MAHPAEFRAQFVSTDFMRNAKGEDISVLAPGPGAQRTIIEGAVGRMRNELLRKDTAAEQEFIRDSIKYLEIYPGVDSRWRQDMVDQALKVKNYHNFDSRMLFAALYFRQLAGLQRAEDITADLMDRYAPTVLTALPKAEDRRNPSQRQLARDYDVQLKADLFRYLRYITTQMRN